MFHLHFVKKLSGRIQVNKSSSSYNKLERHIKPELEDYMIDNFLSKDRQSLNWLVKPSSQSVLENKLGLLPIISKFGY